MTNVITKVGEYVMHNSFRATVDLIDGQRALGRSHPNPSHASTSYTMVWNVSSGKVIASGLGYDHGAKYDIVGPYVPARKRVEGWVNRNATKYQYPTSFWSMCTEDPNHLGQFGDDYVKVREINPTAEKEAREIWELWKNESFLIRDPAATACNTALRRALSLLLSPCT